MVPGADGVLRGRELLPHRSRRDLRPCGDHNPLRHREDAVRLANDSAYGLGGAVFTANEQRGLAIARRIRTGTFNINHSWSHCVGAVGGVKGSGIGREHGPEGAAEYLEYKSITISEALAATLSDKSRAARTPASSNLSNQFNRFPIPSFTRPQMTLAASEMSVRPAMSALDAIMTRVSSLRLRDPGPTEQQLQTILAAGAHAPDHGRMTPWRFVIIVGDQRERFGRILADSRRRAKSGGRRPGFRDGGC